MQSELDLRITHRLHAVLKKLRQWRRTRCSTLSNSCHPQNDMVDALSTIAGGGYDPQPKRFVTDHFGSPHRSAESHQYPKTLIERLDFQSRSVPGWNKLPQRRPGLYGCFIELIPRRRLPAISARFLLNCSPSLLLMIVTRTEQRRPSLSQLDLSGILSARIDTQTTSTCC